MREILFRGKRADNGEWIYGGISKSERTGAWFITNMGKDKIGYIGCHEEIDPSTVGQFTGLTDKNGKKIFEWDIVRYQFDNDDCPFPNKHTEKIIGRILFSDWRSSFSVTAGKNGSDMLNNDLFNYVRNGNRVEVIGNIHDNPELLDHDHH